MYEYLYVCQFYFVSYSHSTATKKKKIFSKKTLHNLLKNYLKFHISSCFLSYVTKYTGLFPWSLEITRSRTLSGNMAFTCTCTARLTFLYTAKCIWVLRFFLTLPLKTKARWQSFKVSLTASSDSATCHAELVLLGVQRGLTL